VSDQETGAAAELLAHDLGLLTGHPPQRRRLVPGRSHVHRIALTWCGSESAAAVCLQVLLQRSGEPPGTGWTSAEARAVAEACDLKAGGPERDPRAPDPRYHLVLVDPGPGDPAVAGRRCAALEAGFLDGAGWMRLHAGGRFAEGTFGRVVDRVRADVRARLGPPDAPEPAPPPRPGGLC